MCQQSQCEYYRKIKENISSSLITRVGFTEKDVAMNTDQTNIQRVYLRRADRFSWISRILRLDIGQRHQ